MSYRIFVDGFENQEIEYQPAGIISNAKLLINGEPVPRKNLRGRMDLTRDDGRVVEAVLQAKTFLSPVQNLEVDGQVYSPEGYEPLKWYEYLWSGVPLLLIFMGGLLGGIFGGLGFWANTQIFNKDSLQPVLKYAITLGINIAAFVLYFVFAFLFNYLIYNL